MIDQWNGCYDDGWKDLIVPEAFSHPAKYSLGLIRRIYNHAKEQGWIKQGDIVLDPFGGVALGGREAMIHGLIWIGVELEEKFVNLGQQNIELWNRQLKGWPNLGTARIVQGDSRRLRDVIKEASLVVSPPPYAEGLGHKMRKVRPIDVKKKLHMAGGILSYGESVGQLASMPEGNFQDVIEKADLVISSPPYANEPIQKNSGSIDRKKQYVTYRSQGGGASFEAFSKTQELHSKEYGHTPGNLANMKEGDIDLVVSSPPYAGSMNTEKCGIDYSKIKKDYSGRVMHKERIEMMKYHHENRKYGYSEGQLGSIKEGSFDLCVSSPPYEEGLGHISKDAKDFGINRLGSGAYGSSKNNLGLTKGDTFWSASKEIVQECYELLKPGGHAVWVTKAYCKKGAIVDFPGRWKALCESVGFKMVCKHRAMLVKSYGTQLKTNGEEEHIEISRKSFFRRLHETKRPDLKINWEMVQCMVKDK